MIRKFFRLILLGIILIVLIIIFAPTLIKGAGNALLTSANDSSAQGIAQILPHAQGKGADLQIKLDGLTANSPYYVSLDQGQCSGASLYTVGRIVTDGNGAATTTLPLNDLQNSIQQNLWLNVHRGSDTSGQSVACGQVLSNDNVLSQFGNAPTVTTSSSSLVVNPSISNSSNSTDVPNGVVNTNNPAIDTNAGTDNNPQASLVGRRHSITAFPDTGVAPAKSNFYDNYSFPRKY
ncbi:MAG: hypothetical protein NVS4B7_13340 [Ktedonobacteraceae bacterium]